MKSFVCAAVLALASFAVANAKSYDIILSNSVKAGPVEIKAGAYTVKVKGDSAIFISTRDGKTSSAPVKLESSGPKHNSTTAVVATEPGGAVLRAIKLGGSNTTLEFSE